MQVPLSPVLYVICLPLLSLYIQGQFSSEPSLHSHFPSLHCVLPLHITQFFPFIPQ